MRERLVERARMVRTIRAFFDAIDYLEVDTPLLQACTNTDVHIQSVRAQLNGREQYLQTSPEFAMKRLLAAGSGSIFQITHAFRDEEEGRLHRGEFSLLEWYSVGMDYRGLMRQLQQLIQSLQPQPAAFCEIAYFECFERYLDLDLRQADDATLRSVTYSRINGLVAPELARDDCLDLLMSEVIAPQFNGYTLVYDYPASQASLARLSASDPTVAERFELFHDGMELANGFGELTDATEQRRRFADDNRRRAEIGLPQYPIDEDFLAALSAGMPSCSGVAVGLDRLHMVVHGRDSVADTLALG